MTMDSGDVSNTFGPIHEGLPCGAGCAEVLEKPGASDTTAAADNKTMTLSWSASHIKRKQSLTRTLGNGALFIYALSILCSRFIGARFELEGRGTAHTRTTSKTRRALQPLRFTYR